MICVQDVSGCAGEKKGMGRRCLTLTKLRTYVCIYIRISEVWIVRRFRWTVDPAEDEQVVIIWDPKEGMMKDSDMS